MFKVFSCGRDPQDDPGQVMFFFFFFPPFPFSFFLFLLLFACSRSKTRRYQIGRWVEPHNALLRIYDLTVLLDISLNTLLGILGEIDSFFLLFPEKRTHNIHLAVFLDIYQALLLFLQPKVFGRLAGWSVGRLLNSGKQ